MLSLILERRKSMRLLIKFYHKNILEDIIAPLGLNPEILVFYYDPKFYTHSAVYSTYIACKKYIPHLKLEIGTYSFGDTKGLEDKLTALVDAYKNDEIILDLSGGNELTSIAAYRCHAQSHLQLVYSDVYTGKIYWIDSKKTLSCPKFDMVDIIGAVSGKLISYSDDDYLEKHKSNLSQMAQHIIDNQKAWSDTCYYFQKHTTSYRLSGDMHFHEEYSTHNKMRNQAPDIDLLYAFNRFGIISNLKVTKTNISFDFKDEHSMDYLTTYGIWLELLTYYAMKSSSYFHDVHTSMKLDWNRNDDYEIIGNEVDGTAMYGCIPILISCKMSEKSTDADAINELYTVSHRMSRGYAIRVLVTYSDIKKNRMGLYLKAKEMGIIVMDRSDLMRSDFANRIERAIVKNSTIIR